MKKIGIIICDRYKTCAGGKCFRSLQEKQGAFERYQGEEVQLVGYTSCGGCPGGNIEYAPSEMIKNGAEVIHLATGMVVGYPPCPYLSDFISFIPEKYKVEVVLGTHPIPEKYLITHENLNSWNSVTWKDQMSEILPVKEIRLLYD